MGPEAAAFDHVVVDALHPDPAVIDQLGTSLRAGSLVAFPTETVYGIGAAIDRPDALRRIFEVKGRPRTDPLIVHVADESALEGVVDRVPSSARALAAAFWPGPLTIVLGRGPIIGDEVTANGPSVGVRVPAHPVAERLLRAAGIGVAAPSANRFGRISPTTAEDVITDLGAHLRHGDAVVDAGPTPLGIESTVVDLTGDRPAILRHGGVPLEDVTAVIGDVDGSERRVTPEETASAAPGGLLRHYAPNTPLVLVEGDRDLLDRLVVGLDGRGVHAGVVDLPSEAAGAAAVLYRRLRQADGSGADVLLAAALAPAGLGRGINDRLFRAAHGVVVLDSSPATLERLVALR